MPKVQAWDSGGKPIYGAEDSIYRLKREAERLIARAGELITKAEGLAAEEPEVDLSGPWAVGDVILWDWALPAGDNVKCLAMYLGSGRWRPVRSDREASTSESGWRYGSSSRTTADVGRRLTCPGVSNVRSVTAAGLTVLS
jgi:hypothetical protein